MQIVRDVMQFEEAALHLGQRPVEELGVVGLEVDLAAELQHLFIFFEERVVRQPPLCVLFAGPRIAEVDVEQVDLVVGEERVDVRGVERDEKDVFQAHADRGLHREHQCIGHALDRDEQHVRLRRSRLDGEFALAAADLDAQLAAARHQAPPVAAQRLRLVDPDGFTGVHARLEIVSSSHSHGKFLGFTDFWSLYHRNQRITSHPPTRAKKRLHRRCSRFL